MESVRSSEKYASLNCGFCVLLVPWFRGREDPGKGKKKNQSGKLIKMMSAKFFPQVLYRGSLRVLGWDPLASGLIIPRLTVLGVGLGRENVSQ